MCAANSFQDSPARLGQKVRLLKEKETLHFGSIFLKLLTSVLLNKYVLFPSVTFSEIPYKLVPAKSDRSLPLHSVINFYLRILLSLYILVVLLSWVRVSS